MWTAEAIFCNVKHAFNVLTAEPTREQRSSTMQRSNSIDIFSTVSVTSQQSSSLALLRDSDEQTYKNDVKPPKQEETLSTGLSLIFLISGDR